MNDSKFQALIALLDDTDPIVSQTVEEELCALGTHGIARLEQAWEHTPNEVIQRRLEELIGKIQTEHYTKELFEWRLEGGTDLIHGWSLLTQIQYPTLNVQKYRQEIRNITHKIWLQMRSQMQDIEKLCVINKELYGVEKFNGNYQEPEKPENNFLSTLMDSRLGNSLSLSALYYAIAYDLEIPLQVVNFMGYYALRYVGKSQHFYIDTYNKGSFFTPIQVQQFLNKLKADPNVSSYKPLSNIYIILQIINNLIETYQAKGKIEKVQLYQSLLTNIDIKFDY